MVQDKIINTIKKLSAKAESAKEIGNVAEAALFSAKVSELLLKHNLEMAEIASEDQYGVVGDKHADLNLDQRWKINLLSVLTQYNFCKPVYHRIPKGARSTRSGSTKTVYAKETHTTIIGTPENVEVVKYLYSLLVEQFERLGMVAWSDKLTNDRRIILERGLPKSHPGYKKPWRVFKTTSPNIYKNSFYVGAVRGVLEKLEAQMTAAQITNTKITDLVLVHDAKIDEYMQTTFGDIKTMRSAKLTINNAAYRSGIRAGNTVSMARGVATGDQIATKLLG